MKALSDDNFVNIYAGLSDQVNNDEFLSSDSWQDPLQGLGNIYTESKYYRVDSVVFAEPLSSLVIKEKCSKPCKSDGSKERRANEETLFIDNLMIQKRNDKRNYKYNYNIDECSAPMCPQPNCNSKFSTMTLLKAHIRKVHCIDKNKYMCERCGAGFTQRYLLKRHSAVHEMRKVECPVCHKMLSERTSLTQHLRSHSDSRQHECRVCHKLFLRQATLKIHVQFVHRNGDLQCDKCNLK